MRSMADDARSAGEEETRTVRSHARGDEPTASPPRRDVEAIWAEVGAELDAFVRRRISDPHHAADVVAEVLARIHERLGSVDDQERVVAWVWRITRNAITDHYRRTARRRDVPGEHDLAVDLGADAWIDDQEAVLRDLAACIRPLVAALPEGYRRALELADLEGRTQAEAARLEGISVSGMKSRVQRGRRLLAALIRDCCEISTDRRGGPVDVRLRSGGSGCSPACGATEGQARPVS